MMKTASAQTKMKALVVSRLLLGDISDWQTFERERETARKVANRRTARSVSSQIGRSYRELSIETRKFIEQNFTRCDYDDLARLCDAIEPPIGIYLQLDEFEKSLLPLATPIKVRFPIYAHVSISTWGFQFEFPEHHFISDLEAGLEGLEETRSKLVALGVTNASKRKMQNKIARLIGREKFLSRSMVSASFSLVEAFLSGLFYTVLSAHRLGKIRCDSEFVRYASKKEGAPLKDRVDRVVKFVSSGNANGQSDPFKSFIEIGKRYRDAIHHTTPFERRDLNAGQRLIDLYEVKADVALLCTLLALDSVLTISKWMNSDDDVSIITESCRSLREKAAVYSLDQGFAKSG